MKVNLNKEMIEKIKSLKGKMVLVPATFALVAGITLAGCDNTNAVEPTTPVTSEVVSEEISENEVSENEVSEEEMVEEEAQYPNAPQVLELTEEEKYTYTQVSDEVAYAKIEEIKQTCLEELGDDYETWEYLQAFLALNRNCLSEEVINGLTNELAIMADEWGHSEENSYSYFFGSNCIELNEMILDDELRHHAVIMEYFATADDLTDEEQLSFFQNYCLAGNNSYTNYSISDYENMPELRLIDVYYVLTAMRMENTQKPLEFSELCNSIGVDPYDFECGYLYDEFQSIQK